MSTILIVIIILLFFGALGGAPTWGTHPYGWGPSGGLGLVLVILLILLLLGRF